MFLELTRGEKEGKKAAGEQLGNRRKTDGHAAGGGRRGRKNRQIDAIIITVFVEGTKSFKMGGNDSCWRKRGGLGCRVGLQYNLPIQLRCDRPQQSTDRRRQQSLGESVGEVRTSHWVDEAAYLSLALTLRRWLAGLPLPTCHDTPTTHLVTSRLT
ncbi:hypothetical protein J6590_032566 [Homalodisca vitripennis]|nr:hypothetical protein J6590_032566 [Homalodisca vitripennis]